jgi:hypothetical protein
VATDILVAAAGSESDVRPYAPSWADRFVDWLEALPGPGWAPWLGFLGIGFVATTLGGWATGLVPVPRVDAVQSSYALFLVLPFFALRVLDRAAVRSLRAFAPALGADAGALTEVEYRLTTIPARPALAIAVVGSALDGLSWLADPVATQVMGPPWAIAGRAAIEFTIVSAWLVLTFQVIRQLRLVSELHGQASRIDLFRQAPLHAFSHLTVRVGVVFIAVAALTLLTSTLEQLLQPITLAFLLLIVLTGISAFVVPLLGLHGRLVAEKGRLIDAANDRLKVTMGRLDESVDAWDLGPADQIQKTLGSLVQQRDIVGRLRTWPWDPSTFRAFATAIALPIGLWIVTRVLERVI